MSSVWGRMVGITIALCLGLVITLGSVESKADDGGGKLYTASNIWIENPGKVWSTNYKRGWILSAGTEIRDVKQSKKAVQFVVAETGVAVKIVFVGKHHPGTSASDIHDRLVTGKDFEALTAGFSEQEIEAIKKGAHEVGMSKESILVSLGYPPEIQTPSTDSNVWKFWAHRFNTFDLHFDDQGKVETIVD